MSEFSNNIYSVIKKIPKGMVSTYGDVALQAGHPGAARAVGMVLHHNPEPGIIPCHRVVFCDGSLANEFAFGGKDAQRLLLEMENIEFKPNGKVDMQKHLYNYQ